MSFNRIYGLGNTPSQALIYSKMNEIECNSKTPFLRISRLYHIEKPDNISVDNLELKIIIASINKNIICSDQSNYDYLKSYYGNIKLEEILKIYSLNNDIALCIKCQDSYSKGYNLYKFLF